MKKTKHHKPPDVLEPGERSEYFEGLLKLQADNPKAFKVLSPSLKIALGRYEQNRERKRAA